MRRSLCLQHTLLFRLVDILLAPHQLTHSHTESQCSDWSNTTQWLEDYYQSLNLTVENITTAFPISGIWTATEANVFMKYQFDIQSLLAGAATPGSLLVATNNNLTICPINTTHIDAEVACVRSLADREVVCSTTRARHSSGYPLSSFEPTFDANVSQIAPNNLISAIPGILPVMHPMYQSPLEAWLADPLRGGIADPETEGYGVTDEYTSLPPGIFDARLTVIFNTILRGSYRTDVILGTDGTDPNNYTYNLDTGYPDQFGNITGQWLAFDEPVYQVKTGWLALYIVSIAVMFVCAIGAIFLRARTRAPDFLNNVSALARNSPHVRKPQGGSTLDGIQMANALGHKRIRVGDIRPDDEYGHIVFADEELVRQRTLRKDRLYI